MKISALILAAGLGTRLRPLTNHKPKALVSLGGRSLLEHTVRKLLASGIEHIVVNTHHFAPLIEAEIAQHHAWGAHIQLSDETSLLLDTGGAIAQAAQYLPTNNHLLVHNVDILSNIKLQSLVQHHQSQQAAATLAVRQRSSSRQLVFDTYGLQAWRHKGNAQEKTARPAQGSTHELAFSGIHLLSPQFWQQLPHTGQAYSVIDSYLQAAATQRIAAYRHDADFWADLGKIPQLHEIETRIAHEGLFWYPSSQIF